MNKRVAVIGADPSLMTSTMAAPHYPLWKDALDDSLPCYLAKT